MRIANLFAQWNADKFLYVYGIGWHYWDGKRWKFDDRGNTHRAVHATLKRAWAAAFGSGNDNNALQKHIRACESAAGIAGVLAIAATLEQFAVTVGDLDADEYLFNCANGTYDLRTKQLRPHSPADRITKIARAAYDPQAPGGTWAAFLARVRPDEDVRGYLQRLSGVALLGRVIEHVLAILTGTGANGKGTFYKGLCFALGDYASTVEPDLLMHRQGAHPTGEMDLLGLRLAVVSESERDRRLAEATMKRLTGGDTIRARRMRQDFVEFEPSHTPLLITNHLPKVSGDDPAIWRRLRVIPFGVEIPEDERDKHLDEHLQAEADAVLAWAIAGWAEYRRREGLDEPPGVLAATDDYRRDSDAVGRFIAEMCLTGSAVNKATTGDLHVAFEKWRITDGAEPMSQKAFGQALDKMGFPAGPASNSKRWRVGISLIRMADDDESAA